MLPVVRTDLKLIDIFNSLIDSLQKNNKPLEEFERKLGNFSKQEYNLIFPKLRFGMELTFKVLFNNQTIGVPTYSCSVVPHSVVLSGNKVKFFDCNNNNLTSEKYLNNIDPYVVTPWYGSLLDKNISHHEYVFGDFSHVNILDNSKFLNNKFLAYFYSFSSGKPISSIGGGLVSTNNKELYLKLREERNNLYSSSYQAFTLGEVLFSLGGSLLSTFNAEKIKTSLDDFGYLNFLREDITNISLGKTPKKISYYQASLLMKNIERYEDNALEIYNFWKNLLSDFQIEVLNDKEWSNSHMNTRTKSRDELRKIFKKNNIQSYYGATYLNHLIEPYYRNNSNNKFPNSLNNFHTLFQLPINLSNKNFRKLQSKEPQIRKSLQIFLK